MKKVNVTFSIPEDTHRMLQSFVGQRKMSSYVTKLINKALKEKEEELKKAYIMAQKDPDRIEVIKDWMQLILRIRMIKNQFPNSSNIDNIDKKMPGN